MSILYFIWLYGIGVICIALPYIWWPVTWALATVSHAITFAVLMLVTVLGQRKGGIFDSKRDNWRGYAGVIAYFLVFLNSALAYRWMLLPE